MTSDLTSRPTTRAAMSRWWASAIRAHGPLSDDDLAMLASHLTPLRLRRGATLLDVGERPTTVGVVREGVIRESFLLAGGKERTRGFAAEGDLTGSLSDLLRGGPARTIVVADTDAEVVIVPWAIFLEAALARPAWQAFLHGVTERLYLAKAEREFELLALDSAERYRRFRARYPGLEARVTQRHVASYLGVTPEHLSRLRARERKRLRNS